MIASALHAELYDQLRQKVQDDAVRDALAYLIGMCSFLEDFDCHPQHKGTVLDFRFIRKASEKRPFALIAAQRHLRFYFRPPAMRDPNYSFEALRELFDSAENARKSKEWTVKLRSIDDVRRLWAYLKLA